jgi:hypothetical protein
MHRIFGRDDHYCKEYGQKRDEVKYIHFFKTKYLRPAAKGWAKV